MVLPLLLLWKISKSSSVPKVIFSSSASAIGLVSADEFSVPFTPSTNTVESSANTEPVTSPVTVNPVTVAPVKSTLVPLRKSTKFVPLPIVIFPVCVAPMLISPCVPLEPLPPTSVRSPPSLFKPVESPPDNSSVVPCVDAVVSSVGCKLEPSNAPPAVSASVILMHLQPEVR